MVLENIYAHPKEDYWKFKGEEGRKSQKKSMNPKGMVGGGGAETNKPSMGEMDIFCNTTMHKSLCNLSFVET